jgi:hypothetical protein
MQKTNNQTLRTNCVLPWIDIFGTEPNVSVLEELKCVLNGLEIDVENEPVILSLWISTEPRVFEIAYTRYQVARFIFDFLIKIAGKEDVDYFHLNLILHYLRVNGFKGRGNVVLPPLDTLTDLAAYVGFGHSWQEVSSMVGIAPSWFDQRFKDRIHALNNPAPPLAVGYFIKDFNTTNFLYTRNRPTVVYL